MLDVWYLRDAHGSLGPFTKRELVQTIGTYPVPEAVQISSNKQGPWQPASTLPNLGNPTPLFRNPNLGNPTAPRSPSGLSPAERQAVRAVEEALYRVRSDTNAWAIVNPLAVKGAIGFALEYPLFDYLTNPEEAEVPRGAVALCVFHKGFEPRAAKHRGLWQIEPERYRAYPDQDDRNTSVQRAEGIIAGRPRILISRCLEFGCLTLLEQLGYDVTPLKGQGKKQSGIDIEAEKRDPEEEEEIAGPIVAVECKTTAQGFESTSMSVLFKRVLKSLNQSRNHEEVNKIYTKIRQRGGAFDYLIAANRQFRLPDFREREGYFLLRGIEVQSSAV